MYSEKTLKVNGKGTLWVLFVTGMTGLCLSLSLRIKQTRFALTVQLCREVTAMTGVVGQIDRD